MIPYQWVWPVVRCLPPETAHNWGLWALQYSWPWVTSVESDPWEFAGRTFRNRLGIAAGFDKNATALPGLCRLGVGFVEIGTVLLEPWAGNPPPRLRRVEERRAVWNRLGFPHEGLPAVIQRLAAWPREQRQGMLVGCNVGPHPGQLKSAATTDEYLKIAAGELQQLVDGLEAEADFFVVNLSSPNTQGLRDLLTDRRLTEQLVLPLQRRLQHFAAVAERPAVPLLLKLPPEDVQRQRWTSATLSAVVDPLLDAAACDGFVAVNTSTRLAQELLHEAAGGLSGRPLLETGLETVSLLRQIIGPKPVIIGCGGIDSGRTALEFVDRGANLVELYTGLIYEGPALPARIVGDMAAASRSRSPVLSSV
jgi:dihydroorotate dehydrogenase